MNSTSDNAHAITGLVPWSRQVLLAVLRDAGWPTPALARMWGVSLSTVRRVLGLETDPFGTDFSARREEIVAILAAHLKRDVAEVRDSLGRFWGQAAA